MRILTVDPINIDIAKETKIQGGKFEISAGDVVLLTGPNGCGKSTILNIISSLEKVSSGNIIINGKLGYMFQKDNLLSWRNIFNNVCLGLEITKQKSVENINYVTTLLNKYGLSNYINYFPNELSGGVRQK